MWKSLLLMGVFGMAAVGCGTMTKEKNPDKYVDYRSDQELLEKRAKLEVATEAYAQKGPPNDMTNRRKLPSLGDEIAADQVREKQQVERTLAERYRQGDKKAYFEGIEKVPLTSQ